MQQPHVDAPRALPVSAKFIGLLHQSKIRAVCLFPALPQRGGVHPSVIPGLGDTGDPAQSADAQHIAVPPYSLTDEAILHFCRRLDSHCFWASVFAA